MRDPRGTCLDSDEIHVGPATPPAEEGLHLQALGAHRVRQSEESLSTWPRATTCHCWWCFHAFSGPPIPLPVKYDERTRVFTVKGNFCSWACAKAYNIDENSMYSGQRGMLLTLLRKHATGRIEPTPCAPPRVALEMFRQDGQGLSIQQFRDSDMQTRWLELPEKMIVQVPRLAKVEVDRKRQVSDADRPVDFSGVKQVNEVLRLKRPKPLGTDRGTVAKSFGFGLFGPSKKVCGQPHE